MTLALVYPRCQCQLGADFLLLPAADPGGSRVSEDPPKALACTLKKSSVKNFRLASIQCPDTQDRLFWG